MEQQIWMSRPEFRDRGFNELGSPAIFLAYLKSRHAIEGQSNSPTGDVSVAEKERPRLGRPVRARPSTVTGNRPAPKCDGVAARLSPARNQMYQRISIICQKCKQFCARARRSTRNSSFQWRRLNLPRAKRPSIHPFADDPFVTTSRNQCSRFSTPRRSVTLCRGALPAKGVLRK